jgi:hypothetical protein
MASDSAIVPLGLAGIASVFLLSGIQGKSLGQILEGDFGNAASSTERSQSGTESDGSETKPESAGGQEAPSPNNIIVPGNNPNTGFPGQVAQGPVYSTNCHIGSYFPCGPNASTLLELANVSVSHFGLQVISTTNGVHTPQSYNYYGRAFDVSAPAGIPQAHVNAFAEYVKRNYGAKLLELYYAPLRIAIRNGKSISYAASGQTCTSCVHVAM